ncbi:MAG: BlaI/MecI/CopY family transcriptional regulator [Verrucomicrobiota bacterium]
MSSEPDIPHLNRSQLHVLQILWDAKQPLKPAEIQERFAWPIENATLRSILRVLLERGDLQREKLGKAYRYKPAREKQSALSDLLGGLANVFSSGSRAGLLAQLLQDDSLSPEEVRELTRIANKSASARKSS